MFLSAQGTNKVDGCLEWLQLWTGDCYNGCLRTDLLTTLRSNIIYNTLLGLLCNVLVCLQYWVLQESGLFAIIIHNWNIFTRHLSLGLNHTDWTDLIHVLFDFHNGLWLLCILSAIDPKDNGWAMGFTIMTDYVLCKDGWLLYWWLLGSLHQFGWAVCQIGWFLTLEFHLNLAKHGLGRANASIRDYIDCVFETAFMFTLLCAG